MTGNTATPLPYGQSSDSYIKQLFKGDIPLVITYWVYGVLVGNVGFRILAVLIEDNYASLAMNVTGNWLIVGTFWLGIAYSLFILVAIWRSAGKYQGSATWSSLARVFVVLGTLATISQLLISLQVTQDSDSRLIEEMKLMNNSLPKQIDSETRLDTVLVKDGNIYYNYTLVNYMVEDIDLEVLKARMSPKLIDSSCTTEETRKLLNEGRTVAYVYRDQESKPVHEFKIAQGSCFSDQTQSTLTEASPGSQSSTSQSIVSPEELFDRYSEAVVLIRTYSADGSLVGFGSGFNVGAEGLIVTNLHVILSGGEYIDVKFPKHGVYEEVFIEGFSNADIDLALLRVDGKELPIVEYEDPVSVKVGERIYTITNPEGMVNTLSEGLISANRSFDGVELYQITAPISQGSSGGPVFDEHGKVIGVATKILTEGQNLNFATSFNEIANIEIFEEYFTLKQLLDTLAEDDELQ